MAQKGNALLVIISGVALVAIFAAGYFFWQNQQFQQVSNNQQLVVSKSNPAPTPVQGETANWKTYIDEVDGRFSFKYPSQWYDQPRQKAPNGGYIEGKYLFNSNNLQSKDILTFTVQKGIRYPNLPLDRVTRVFNSPVGIISSSSIEILTKIANLEIDGHDSVHFTDEHISGETPAGFEDVFAINDNSNIYTLNFYAANKQIVKGESKSIGQILSTFKFL